MAPFVCMCVFFLIPQCETISRPTAYKFSDLNLSVSSSPDPPSPAAIRTAQQQPLCRLTWVQSCIKARIWERNENWHQPDYNYPYTLSISVQFTPLSARGFLFLDAILLRVQMDSEHIWSGNWPSICKTRAQQSWQRDLVLLLGEPLNFDWPDLTALRSLAKRFL